MSTLKKTLLSLCFIVVTLMAIPFCAYSAMTFFLKDGRSFTIPVVPDEILSISFDASAAPTATFSKPDVPLLSGPPVSDGLAVWLDASDLSTLFQASDGLDQVSVGNQSVGLWRDKSSNDNHMMQSRAESRPRLTKSGIGSKPAITFETSQSLTLPTNFPSPVSVFYVARMTGGVNARALNASKNNWLLGYWGGGKSQAYYEGWVSPQGTPPTDNLPHVFTSIVKGPGQNSEVWADGRMIASNQGGVTGPNGLTINAGPYGEASNCQVAEILVYNRVLSADERAKVETYLKNRWNTSR
jgi:hypothetical protein